MGQVRRMFLSIVSCHSSCQGVSNAGYGKGLMDVRSNLIVHTFRLFDELGDPASRPRGKGTIQSSKVGTS